MYCVLKSEPFQNDAIQCKLFNALPVHNEHRSLWRERKNNLLCLRNFPRF